MVNINPSVINIYIYVSANLLGALWYIHAVLRTYPPYGTAYTPCPSTRKVNSLTASSASMHEAINITDVHNTHTVYEHIAINVNDIVSLRWYPQASFTPEQARRRRFSSTPERCPKGMFLKKNIAFSIVRCLCTFLKHKIVAECKAIPNCG